MLSIIIKSLKMNNKRDRKTANSNMRWINKWEDGETMGKIWAVWD